jgi:uncharacterized protein YbjT (DUF2867 family)
MPGSTTHQRMATQPKRVLVTGATGKQGGALARLLVQRGHRVRALTRKPDSPAAAELARLGVEVVQGDLGDRASVERAAGGMDVLFLVATPYEQGPEAETRFGINAVDAAKAARVPYIVYSSVSDADRKTGIPHFDGKRRVEEHLAASGIDHAIVAPVYFMENLLVPWTWLAPGLLGSGTAADRPLQAIALEDIAEFTALAVEERARFRGTRTNIASDELTFVGMARRISEDAGSPVAYQPLPLDKVRAVSEDLAKMYDWFNRVGYSADIPRLKREFPEVRWRSFADWSSAQDWSRVLAPARKA